jgi:aryl-alcohol dehydrogenase-like predicted oxidoreductase
MQHGPVIPPIPGTLRVAHLEENVAAAALSLNPEEICELDAASPECSPASTRQTGNIMDWELERGF